MTKRKIPLATKVLPPLEWERKRKAAKRRKSDSPKSWLKTNTRMSRAVK